MPVLPRSAMGWIVHRLDTAALIVRGDSPMASPRVLHSAAPLIALALLLLTGAPRPQAQPAAPPAVPIDADDIRGVGTGEHGPGTGEAVLEEANAVGTHAA